MRSHHYSLFVTFGIVLAPGRLCSNVYRGALSHAGTATLESASKELLQVLVFLIRAEPVKEGFLSSEWFAGVCPYQRQ